MSRLLVLAMIVPVIMTALYVMAMLVGLSDPYAVMLCGLFMVSSLMAWAPLHRGRRTNLGHDIVVIAWLGLGGCSYLLVASCWSPIASAWWKGADRAAFCLMAISVACMQGDVHRAIRFLGLSTLLWFLVGMATLVMASTDVSYDMAIVGAGNINWIMNPVSVVAVFWSCSAWSSSATATTCGRFDRILSLALVAIVACAAIALGRRGSMVGILVGLASALLAAASRRQWWIIAVIPFLAVVAAGAISISRWGGISNYLNEPHVHMLASASQVALTALPWGDGGYASITHAGNASESCRHLTASGQRMLQSHNELLDLIADGGVVLLMLVLVGAVILVRRWRRVQDAAVKIAIAGASGAVGTVAMVDNAFSHFGGAVFVALVVGLLLKTEAKEDREVSSSLAYLPIALLLTMTLAAVGSMLAIASRRGDASMVGDIAIANRIWNPMVLDVFLEGVLRRAGEVKDAGVQARCVELFRARLGPSIGLAAIAARLERARGDGEAELRLLQEELRLQPFSLATYARVSELLQDNPELVVRCDPRMVGRIRCMMPGVSPAGSFDLPLDAGIESAADAFAQVVGQAVNHQEWNVVLLARITDTYGDVPDVAIAALGCLMAAPAGSVDAFSSSAGQLLRGLRSVNVVSILARVRGVQEARRSIEGLRRLGLNRLGKDVAAEMARIEALAAGEVKANG